MLVLTTFLGVLGSGVDVIGIATESNASLDGHTCGVCEGLRGERPGSSRIKIASLGRPAVWKVGRHRHIAQLD